MHTGEGRGKSRESPAALEGDALQHDNRVVEGHADGEGNAGERDDINRAPGNYQSDECGDGANRDTDDTEHCGLDRAQKQKHHQRREHRADAEIRPHV